MGRGAGGQQGMRYIVRRVRQKRQLLGLVLSAAGVMLLVYAVPVWVWAGLFGAAFLWLGWQFLRDH